MYLVRRSMNVLVISLCGALLNYDVGDCDCGGDGGKDGIGFNCNPTNARVQSAVEQSPTF